MLLIYNCIDMKINVYSKRVFQLVMAFVLCLIIGGCKKTLTPEERKANLETKISENDCKEITNNALQAVLNNLRDIKYESVLHGVEEDGHFLSKVDDYYISVVVRGSAKGVFNGVESVYSFYLYGRIPENKADKKEFDDDGYKLSLKKNDGLFVYSNKEDINVLNKEKLEQLKKSEEIRKVSNKDRVAIENALQKEWDISNSNSAVGAVDCNVFSVKVDKVEGNTVYVSYSLKSEYASGDKKFVKLSGAKLTKDGNGNYKVESTGY